MGKYTVVSLICLQLWGIASIAQSEPQRSAPEVAKMCKAMGAALGNCVLRRQDSEALVCDQLLDALLARQDLTADDLLAIAQVARIRKQPQKAIAAVERRLQSYPGEDFRWLTCPGQVVGQFWIASIAAESGDVARACLAYESIARYDDVSFKMLGYLLHADTLARSGNETGAKELLKKCTVASTKTQKCAGWASYYLECLEQGAATARGKMSRTGDLANSDLLADVILVINGVGVLHFPAEGTDALELPSYLGLEKANSEVSGIVGDAARLHAGVWYATKNSGRDYGKAKVHLTALSRSDSYLAPEAGLWILRCSKNEQKAQRVASDDAPLVRELKNRFPGYVSEIDKTDKEASLRN